MLFSLFNELSQHFSALNVFQYITLRVICAVLTRFSYFFIDWPIYDS